MKINFLVLFVFFYIPSSFPQYAFNWKNYMDMKDVQAVISSDNLIYAASTGGAFEYDKLQNRYRTFSKSDGVSGISLSAVTIDNQGKIWLGSTNGMIDVYDPATGSFNTISKITENQQLSAKRINSLNVSGDTVFVASDFGITLIDSRSLFIYDTFFKFGSFASYIKVYNVLRADLIYASTELGVAIQKPGAVNLSAPESWNVYKTTEGLTSNRVRQIVRYQNSLIAGTENGLSIFNGSSWSSYLPELSGTVIKNLFTSGDTLFILAGDNVYSHYYSGINLLYSSSETINALSYSSRLGLYAATTRGIVFITDPDQFYFPNGPYSNRFQNMTVDRNGILWCASGTDRGGVGFYKYDGTYWTNYYIPAAAIPTNFYFNVHAANDNSVYLGSWGSGFLRVRGDELSVFNRSNTGMEGVDENPDFLVIGGINSDSRNNLWVLNFGAVNNHTLSMMTPDAEWYHFPVGEENNRYFQERFQLVVDQFDTKWYVSRESRVGLFYFNENHTYSNFNDDRSGFYSTADNLNDNFIYSLALDRRGELWVGTSLGVNIISNLQNAAQSNDADLRITSVFSLRQQTIRAIAVDPLNQKWIGTNQGLLLVNSDGTQLLASYDTDNSPLPSNEIISIAVDNNTGTVFVGTSSGLVSLETQAVEPKESFEELSIYPNPFLLNKEENSLTIDGLIRDTDIKILTIGGKLVLEFSTPGGRVASWDGRDINGNPVPSGIYLIVAFDAEGNNVITGKVAVIRE